MKGFRFRLEPVLTLRKSQEEQLQRQLADRERELDEARSRLAEIAREIDVQETRMTDNGQPGVLDVDGMLVATRYVAALRGRAEAQRNAVEERKRIVNECRLTLIEATTYRKGLERLREQQLAMFEQELARKEQLGTEEMATQRYQRRVPAEAEAS